MIVYADDFVAGFQYKWEAENYYKLLKERMEKFGLQLENSKSRLLQSGAYIARAKQKNGESIRLQTFDFLGFTFYCGRSRKGMPYCVVFFDTIATFTQTIAGWVVLTGKNMAQISNGISNPVVAGIIYWLIRILICGGCLVETGILLAFIGIKIARLYKKYCWDMITILATLISMAISTLGIG